MDNYTATEQAYKNGYEQGKKDAVKHGHNLAAPGAFECSLCGWEDWDTVTADGQYNYCPNCGAHMKDGE